LRPEKREFGTQEPDAFAGGAVGQRIGSQVLVEKPAACRKSPVGHVVQHRNAKAEGTESFQVILPGRVMIHEDPTGPSLPGDLDGPESVPFGQGTIDGFGTREREDLEI